MQYLLDTNICIYIIKRKPIRVIEKISDLSPSDVGISSITVAELAYGVNKSRYPEKNRLALNHFLSPFGIFDFDLKAAMTYGQIWTDLDGSETNCQREMNQRTLLIISLILVTKFPRILSE